jgi:cytochrome c2
VSRKRLVVVGLAGAAVALAGAATALAARGAAPQKSYKVSATLKGTGAVSGLFSATLATTGSKGTLSWKLTLKPSGTAASAQIRSGATASGALLLSLCAPCSAGAHAAKTVSGGALKSIAGGHAGLVVKAKTGGTLRGALKATASSSSGGGGGTLTVTPTPALIAAGKAAVTKFGCAGCHTIDGTKSTGPTWKGLAGSKVPLTTGKSVVATDSYLLGVITDPSTLMVRGYDSGIMSEVIPPGAVSATQAKAIIAYIKSVK